jgi:nucleotide-binding universal stress UspA family protein
MPELTGWRALLRKLLVGYDGSAQSERALALAVETSSQNEASVIQSHMWFGSRPEPQTPSPTS